MGSCHAHRRTCCGQFHKPPSFQCNTQHLNTFPDIAQNWPFQYPIIQRSLLLLYSRKNRCTHSFIHYYSNIFSPRKNQKSDNSDKEVIDNRDKRLSEKQEHEKIRAEFTDIPCDMLTCHVCEKNVGDSVVSTETIFKGSSSSYYGKVINVYYQFYSCAVFYKPCKRQGSP